MRQASRFGEQAAARQNRATFLEALRLLVPREHGSWGMLLTVLILPHWVFDLIPAAFALSGAALLLFLARQPAEVLFQRGRPSWEARAARWWVASLVAAGGLVALWALVRAGAFTGPVILLGSLSAGLILAGTLWEGLGQRGSFWARLLAIVGVTLFVPLQNAAAGDGGMNGWGLAVLVLAFFLTTALRVRARLRGRNLVWLRPVGAAIAAGLLAGAVYSSGTALLPPHAYLALVPGTLQTWHTMVRPQDKVHVLRLGLREIAHTALFIVITGLVYTFQP